MSNKDDTSKLATLAQLVPGSSAAKYADASSQKSDGAYQEASSLEYSTDTAMLLAAAEEITPLKCFQQGVLDGLALPEFMANAVFSRRTQAVSSRKDKVVAWRRIGRYLSNSIENYDKSIFKIG